MSRQLSQETIEDALQGQQAVEEVTSSMDTIQQTNSSTVETITRFEQQTQDIGTILDVIDEITDQSSLLALNASIIAAQAGSHGRGFAVIADEMRNLATKVSSSTKDIAAIVKVVQEETVTVVKKIHEGTDDIAQGVRRTQQAREVLQKIFNSAQRSSGRSDGNFQGGAEDAGHDQPTDEERDGSRQHDDERYYQSDHGTKGQHDPDRSDDRAYQPDDRPYPKCNDRATAGSAAGA